MAYNGFSGNTGWAQTDNIDKQIAALTAQKSTLGAGNFRAQGEIDDQINGLKGQKSAAEYMGRMGRGAQLAQLDPATLAGMLLGDYIGNYFGRGAAKRGHSDAWDNMQNGGAGQNIINEEIAKNSQFAGNPVMQKEMTNFANQNAGRGYDATKAPAENYAINNNDTSARGRYAKVPGSYKEMYAVVGQAPDTASGISLSDILSQGVASAPIGQAVGIGANAVANTLPSDWLEKLSGLLGGR